MGWIPGQCMLLGNLGKIEVLVGLRDAGWSVSGFIVLRGLRGLGGLGWFGSYHFSMECPSVSDET